MYKSDLKHQRKKILIIGGEGFIGRNISEVLSKKFDCYSVGIEKSFFTERKDIFIKKNPYKDKIKKEFDVYIHLIDNKVSDEQFEIEENNLINNIQIKKNKHLIIFSSSVIYANPESLYAKRKIKLETIYEKYCKKNNIHLTIFRLFNIYGKYQIPYKQGSLVANIFYNYINDIITEINDINTTRDFIYAKDVGKIILYSIEKKYFSKTDLAIENIISIKHLFEIIENNIVKNTIKIVNKKNIEENTCQNADNKLINCVKLTPQIKSLKETFLFYKNFNDKIKKYLNN